MGSPSHRLDRRGSEGPNLWHKRQTRLSHHSLGVVCDPPRFRGPLKDPAKQGHRLADRVRADPGSDELALESGDGVGVYLA